MDLFHPYAKAYDCIFRLSNVVRITLKKNSIYIPISLGWLLYLYSEKIKGQKYFCFLTIIMLCPCSDLQNTSLGLRSPGFEVILWSQQVMVIFIIYRAETETRRLANMQRRAKLLTQLEGTCSLPPHWRWGRQQHSQHHQTGEVLEGIVRDAVDVVESQGHGLEGRQVVEGSDWDLRECIVIQPEVAERGQPLKAPLRDQGDEVGIQAPGGRKRGWRRISPK